MTTAQTWPAAFDSMWSELSQIGRDPRTGGYRRFAWTKEDSQARDWFAEQAARRGLDVQLDRAGNLWAWWLPPGPHREPADAFVTGSHLDSVPDGGAFDGALGVVSGLAAIDVLRERGVRQKNPVAVVVFADEEGARFGVACAGSRLLTGALDPEKARALADPDGVTMAEAVARAGLDPAKLGPDDETLRRIGVFVELHVEQGRAMVDLDAPVSIATGIWPHGRWRFSFTGKADHAGTTQLDDRRDPMLCYAEAVIAARAQAQEHGGLATFGRVRVQPNSTNGIPSRVDAWLDARAPEQHDLDKIVIGVAERTGRRASVEQVGSAVSNESVSPKVEFSPRVRARLRAVLGDLPEIATGAGHDAGVLAARVPSGMLFVRNPTGVSHAPVEFAERADCLAGVEALAAAMADWVMP